MPPFAFQRSIASSTPCRAPSPYSLYGPVSAVVIPILMVCCAAEVAAPSEIAIPSASAPRALPIRSNRCSIFVLQGVNRPSSRGVGGMLDDTFRLVNKARVAEPVPITMLPESPRSPYPITWKEQDTLFRKLPAHLGRMALFAVNTGLRDSNVCGLQWTWEVAVPELGRSVFVIPPEAFKTKRPHVVILNDVAWSIVVAQRSLHPIWV